MEKLEKGGKVAVVYSPGYGAGWSTWNSENAQALCMDKDIALAVVEEDINRAYAIAKEKFPDAYVSGQELQIRWIAKGTAFRITEYDGYEGIEILGEIDHFIA